MASAAGEICIIKLDDKFLGIKGVVSEIEDARLINIVENGRFTEAKETAKKYGFDVSKFNEIKFKGVAPSFAEQYGYPQDYSGKFKGLSYNFIRKLCSCGNTIRDGLENSDEKVVYDVLENLW